jgi:hypothetical protein
MVATATLLNLISIKTQAAVGKKQLTPERNRGDDDVGIRWPIVSALGRLGHAPRRRVYRERETSTQASRFDAIGHVRKKRGASGKLDTIDHAAQPAY